MKYKNQDDPGIVDNPLEPLPKWDTPEQADRKTTRLVYKIKEGFDMGYENGVGYFVYEEASELGGERFDSANEALNDFVHNGLTPRVKYLISISYMDGCYMYEVILDTLEEAQEKTRLWASGARFEKRYYITIDKLDGMVTKEGELR